MAANPDNYYTYILIPAEFVTSAGELENYELCSILGNRALVRKPIDDDQKRFYNLATAASITGQVRAYLWKSINSVISHGCKVYYCDTDSLITNCKHVEVSNVLGEWKLEQENDRLILIAPKLYGARNRITGEWKIASKGVELTVNDLYALAKGEPVKYERAAPTFSISHSPVFIERNL